MPSWLKERLGLCTAYCREIIPKIIYAFSLAQINEQGINGHSCASKYGCTTQDIRITVVNLISFHRSYCFKDAFLRFNKVIQKIKASCKHNVIIFLATLHGV